MGERDNSASDLMNKEIADEMEFLKRKSIESIRRSYELGQKFKGKLKK